MYRTAEEYFYFKPRMECDGNLLPLRSSDPSDLGPRRIMSAEDLLALYEIAVTKIGLFKWAATGFDSYVPSFPSVTEEGGLDLSGVPFPPYSYGIRFLVNDTEDDSWKSDLLGPSLGSSGYLSEWVPLLSLVDSLTRTDQVNRVYPFRWDDVEFNFESRSNSYDEPGITPSSFQIPASAVEDTETHRSWNEGRMVARLDGFLERTEVGRWFKDESNETGISIEDEMRCVALRLRELEGVWSDILYFDSVAVRLLPKVPYRMCSYTESLTAEGFDYPEVHCLAEHSQGGNVNATYDLVGNFGFAPESDTPEVDDRGTVDVETPASVRWEVTRHYDSYRNYVCTPVATGMRITSSGGHTTVEYDADVYMGCDAEHYLKYATATASVGASGSEFTFGGDSFPLTQIPFDPDMIEEIRGYLTCTWNAQAIVTAYGAQNKEHGVLTAKTDPLTGEGGGEVHYGDPQRTFYEYGRGYFSAEANVSVDLGDGSSGVKFTVSSSAISSAKSAAERVSRSALRDVGSISSPISEIRGIDPMELVPEPPCSFGREFPVVEALYTGSSLEGGSGSFEGELLRHFASKSLTSLSHRQAFPYLDGPSEEQIGWDPNCDIECPGFGMPNGVVPHPDYSSGNYTWDWTTGDEFGLTTYVWGEGTVECDGRCKYPSYNPLKEFSGHATAGTSADTSAAVYVTELWLFVKFRPKCADELALEAVLHREDE